MSESNEAFWKDVREQYEDPRLSVAKVCKKFKITPSALYYHLRKEGWRMRRARSAVAGKGLGNTPSGKLKKAKSGCAKGEPDCGTQQIGARLFEVLEIKLAEIEARISHGDDPSAAENEREQRVIGNLIRNFDKLTEFNERRSGGAVRGGQKNKQKSIADDGGEDLSKLNAMQFREEIARRIEHFEKARKS